MSNPSPKKIQKELAAVLDGFDELNGQVMDRSRREHVEPAVLANLDRLIARLEQVQGWVRKPKVCSYLVWSFLLFFFFSLPARGQDYNVDLAWDAPASSVDPVEGYNVLRSPHGANTYSVLNNSAPLPLSQTTYVDTGVTDGTTYDYVVESVDASNVSSLPSNVATATIPGGPSLPIASVSPLSLTFSSQTVGTTSAGQVITIANTGNATLAISNFTFASGGTAGFASSSNTCGAALAASASCLYTVTFTPTSAGAHSDTLTVTDNSGGAGGAQQMISLSGTGVAVGPTWSATSHPNNAVAWNIAGTTQSCTIAASLTAGIPAVFIARGWTLNGTALTFNSATGDSFTHLASAYAAGALNGKNFVVDAVLVESAAGGSGPYTITENTTSSSGNLDCDIVQPSISAGAATLDGAAAVGYGSCATPCTSPALSLSGPNDFVLQSVAMGYGPAAPGAPYTNPMDQDGTNVYGGTYGALNQSAVLPVTWSTNSLNYVAASVIAFKQVSGCVITSVTASCSPGSVQVGNASSCSPTVNHTGSGCNLAVTWSALHGSISSGGAYTAPATVPSGGTDTVTATSVQNGAEFGTASITVTAAPSTITSVSASCSPSSVEAGRASTCFAVVNGTGSFNSAVTWSAIYGTINSSGTYVAPVTIPPGGTDTVTATSVQNGSISGSFTVTITAPSGGSTLGGPVSMLL
jgi:hypothetical protein